MSSVLVEWPQWLDDDNILLALGKVYIGTNGADPVATAGVTTIFSDRALTVALDNPQTLDSFGRSENKIWVSGTYSIQVNNSAAVQKFQDLDAGSDTSTVNATLFVTSVVGSNTITGSTSDPLSAYISNQQFAFETAGVNAAGGITLNVDGVGAKAIVKNNDQAILPAEFAAAQFVVVGYNATNDNFEWVNQNNKVIDFYEGTPVVAAGTTDIWATDGNTIHVTGTTGITSFGTAPNVGALRRVIFDAAVTLTNSTNLALPGGVNFTAEAGDVAWVYADTVSQFDVVIQKVDGTAVVSPTVVFTASFVSSEQTITSAGSLTVAHSLATIPLLIQFYLICQTAEQGYSIGDRLGPFTVNDAVNGQARGIVCVADSTNLNIRYGSVTNTFETLNFSNGTLTVLTNASWKMELRAWA